MTAAQVATVPEEYWAVFAPEAGNVGGALQDEPLDRAGKTMKRHGAPPLPQVTRAGRAAGEKRRNPRQHRQHPENEPPEAMLCEIWTSCSVHGRNYRAA